MLNQELLIAYFADTLPSEQRARVESEIAADRNAQQILATQQLMDQALRVALGGSEADERVKLSVLAMIRASSTEEIRAQVLAETSGRANALMPVPPESRSSAESASASHSGRRTLWESLLAWAGFGRRGLKFSILHRFAAALVMFVAAIGLYFLGIGGRPAQPIEIGSFTIAVGEPTVRHSGERSTQHAARRTPVLLGDRIETGDADRAEIQFRDGTTLRLQFNTVLEIPNQKSKIKNQKLERPPEINLLLGQVWTKVQKTTNASPYAVRTPVATAVARGTEFGVKLQRATASTNGTAQLSTLNSQALTALAVLTVKEGAVDFSNSFGSVQATAMTESTARAGSAPTEPRRLQTLQVVQVTPGSSWSLVTSALTLPEAAEKLAMGGGWAGLRVRDFASVASAPNTRNSAATGEVRVVQITRQSPAGRAGLQAGDVLLAINGQPVTNASQIEKTILIRPNIETTLNLQRGGEERTVALTITNRTSLLPGPALRPELHAKLAGATRHLVEGKAGSVTPTFQSAKSPVENRRYKYIRRVSDSETLRAAAENNLGVILESEDALAPAIRAYGRAVYVDSQVPLYHFNLGLALRKIGSFERAAEELEIAWRLAPQSTPARQRFAEIQSLLGRDAESLALTDAALEADPQNHGLWELKAQLLTKQSRLAEALEAALKAIQLDPDCIVAHGYFAGVLQSQGRLAEAEATYRKALDLNPYFAPLHVNLGSVQHARQQLSPAEQSYRKAIELQPDSALAYRNLGNVLADKREFAQATAALRKAIELDPDDRTPTTSVRTSVLEIFL